MRSPGKTIAASTLSLTIVTLLLVIPSQATATITRPGSAAVSAQGSQIVVAFQGVKSTKAPIICAVQIYGPNDFDRREQVTLDRTGGYTYRSANLGNGEYNIFPTCEDADQDASEYPAKKLILPGTTTPPKPPTNPWNTAWDTAQKTAQFALCLGGFGFIAAPIVVGFYFFGPSGAINAAKEWFRLIGPVGAGVGKSCLQSVLGIKL